MKKSILGRILQNHFLAMVICCAIPLIAISTLSLMGILGSWGFYAMMFLCPLLHVFMMRGHSHSHEETNEQPLIEEGTMKDRFEGE